MAHGHRQYRFGLPEFTGAMLVISLIALGIGSLLTNTAPVWIETSGRIVSCTITNTHYNAVDTQPKVTLTYAYEVGDNNYSQRWEGFWPDIYSPNALAPSAIESLKDPEHPLLVLYNPENSAESSIHGVPNRRHIAYTWATGISALLTFFYFVRVYPHWKPWGSHR